MLPASWKVVSIVVDWIEETLERRARGAPVRAIEIIARAVDCSVASMVAHVVTRDVSYGEARQTFVVVVVSSRLL